MTERTDFQPAEELDEPDEPDEPDELPWDDVDLDGSGAFAEGVEPCFAGVADEEVDGFADDPLCEDAAVLLEGEAKESNPGPSVSAGDAASCGVRDASLLALSVRTIAVTHAAIVASASAPAR